MIEAHGLVKRYGSTTAVDDLSFSVRPDLVTGFLGPNGAGKPVTGLRHSSLAYQADYSCLGNGEESATCLGRR